LVIQAVSFRYKDNHPGKGKKMLTTADFDNMHQADEYLGFGYIGGRRNHLAEGRTSEVAQADAKAIVAANKARLSYRELFEWANSKNGRWYADCMFGNHGQHADDYLPGKAQR
jgi:hypothetical protein